ncbi:MAG: succinyl-diaminopimelate desuccinylase [Zetaproteobacteria bacterium CG06_land_8_20_14_3_00_59_53]|nr:MAG: succinyl-diaminopimelate desuccinylase [Zetaproteobacteria bacterium CG2_30_59_37]PIO89405.1 MAG: succinyl-diaminopimelate desuccinylase [Zetaproteobacteria bacterium CG23_combo_of_CG06-09_8_20_14_all_59_86]PIQ65377.1 MAG: succinyl-diaminopimelate desuccinylase [Zetaproteobacteria bacterium CG11_big_fil_rev_8_21_14_0_20_59_439]PIU70703.1 MAG: succinyl-diaminopimelate desuccinylase [Zetaproteobacteria bacterium CG06_land_8_20_14_3_00_59_53]PIU98166.1 MAG: succinyl-diaminopimelate desucci
MSAALTHAIELIHRPSPTPGDGECQDYIEALLAPLGFTRTRVDAGGVTNSLYSRPGERPGVLAYAGHTDVVPTGPAERWPHPPFAAVVEDGMLHGRGAQDMKGGIACWLAALEDCCARGIPLPGLQLLITSDEEGDSVDGTIRLVEYITQQGLIPDAAVVGEPSSSKLVGDTIRRGRRGVVHVYVQVEGKQGHSAYPQDADNAIHHAVEALHRILHIDWGTPAADFPPTTCQFTNLAGGEGASNVIPGRASAFADIRYNPGLDFAAIKQRIEGACSISGAVRLDIRHEAAAFYTPDCALLDLVERSIKRVNGVQTLRDTGGGTSDGRFIAAAGIPVVELGLTNDTIHQIGERVAVSELDELTRIYTEIITHFEGTTCP